jgi:hypothetical protein
VTVVFGQRASDQGHELTLTVGVTVDVPLSGQQGPMTSQHLNITQLAAGSMH